MEKKKTGIAFAVIIPMLILTVTVVPVFARGEEQFNLKEGEIVFLLDASGSMNTQDKDGLAVDAVRQAVYSLPSSYQAGLIAYNTEIQLEIPFGVEPAQWDAELETVANSGYTNAGEALNRAMGLFSGRENVERCVILLTDGEIDMPDAQDRDRSRLLYEEKVREAKERGIKIYIVAAGSQWNDSQTHIFDGAEQTDGAIYWAGQSGTLSEIMRRILYERMNFPKRTLEVSASAFSEEGNSGIITVELPASGAEHVKIVLLAERGLQNLTADYTAENGTAAAGQKFAAVDIVRPVGENIVLGFESPDISGVQAYMTVEYLAEMKTQITYWREEAFEADSQDSENQERIYQHFAQIEISLGDIKGENDNLWNSRYYEGRKIPFTVNGALAEGEITGGKLTYSMGIDGIEKADLTMDTSGLAEYFDILQPVTVLFSPPEDPSPEPDLEPEPEPDYRPLWITVWVLFLALTVILILWIRSVRKNSAAVIYMATPQGFEKGIQKKEIKNCTYSGKLNMYVVQTPTGQDVPPQTYRLFGKQNVRITLNQILNSCGIKFGKIGAGDISFYPGADRALVVMDQSEKCTVLRGTEILKKGMGYPVYYNGKLTVTFEDGITVLEIHYMNLKSGELKPAREA